MTERRFSHMKQKKILYIALLTGLLLGGCTGNNTISEEEAKEIALSHAGFTSNQVTFIKSTLDKDNGSTHYDVEFHTEDYSEYDYEIDASSGEILDYDYDAEPYNGNL